MVLYNPGEFTSGGTNRTTKSKWVCVTEMDQLDFSCGEIVWCDTEARYEDKEMFEFEYEVSQDVTSCWFWHSTLRVHKPGPEGQIGPCFLVYLPMLSHLHRSCSDECKNGYVRFVVGRLRVRLVIWRLAFVPSVYFLQMFCNITW